MKRLLRAAPAILFAIGACVLARAAWQAAYSPSMDYAVVVEMARDMAAGADFPTFFHGQTYMGSLEPAISALLCAIFGPHPFWVCMGSALVGIALLFAIMRLARRLGGDAGACVALALAICGGPYWTHFIVSPRGGYALATLLCLAALHLGAVAEFEDGGTGRIRLAPAAALGLAAGLAFWNNWLALPAFAAGGAVLAARLRWKLFSPRLLIPATFAFIAGSAPWWLFAIRNGLGAFASESAAQAPSLHAAAQNLGTVASVFFGVDGGPAEFLRSPYPWVLGAIAALAAADAALCAGPRRRFLAATALHAMIFLLAFCRTPFGLLPVARYFVPLVPAFATAGGAALGAALVRRPARGGGRRPFLARGARWASMVIIAAYAAFVAPSAIRATESLMDGLRRKGEDWSTAMLLAANDPALSQPAFADFRLFGANWVTDRRLCFSSPLCWRYAPYLLNLEKADSPAVIDNSQAFRQFCDSTMGHCRTRAVAGLSVTDEITPPQEVRELPAGDVAEMAMASAADAMAALLDDDLATAAQITPSAPSLDIALGKARTLSGVTAIVTHSLFLRGWRAEALDAEGRPAGLLAQCDPLGGWFWSGPRPYMFGPDSRLELRWKPQPLSRMRITFCSSIPNPADDCMEVTLADLRLLSDIPLPPIDPGLVATAANDALLTIPGANIHAGRWLGGLIGAPPDPALKFGRGASLAIDEVCQFATIDLVRGAIAILRGDAADAADATLSSLGLEHTRTDAGGCTLLAIRPTTSRHPPLRFFGGRLMRDPPPATPEDDSAPRADFGGSWRIESTSHLPATARPGDTIHLDLRISKCGRNPPHALALFAHGVRGGAIVFDGGANANCASALIPADAPRPRMAAIDMKIPDNLPPGPVKIELCVKRIGGWLRLRPVAASAPTDRRRIVLGEVGILPARGDAQASRTSHDSGTLE